MPLSGKIAVLTGATSEIGHATAKRLAHEGASLAITDRTPDKLDSVVEELKSIGVPLYAEALDLLQPEAVNAFFDRVAEKLGPADILVNTAAWRKPGSFLDTDYEDWKRTFDVSVHSYFLCSQAAARQMVPRNRGRIIFYGSVSGVVYMAPFPAYTAAKGAVHAFTKALAIELAPYGITVNEVAPGPVETNYLRQNLSPEAIQARIDRMPPGRLATPEDCAAAVAHLVAPDMDYITGQTLYVDGGFTGAGVVPPARIRKQTP